MSFLISLILSSRLCSNVFSVVCFISPCIFCEFINSDSSLILVVSSSFLLSRSFILLLKKLQLMIQRF